MTFNVDHESLSVEHLYTIELKSCLKPVTLNVKMDNSAFASLSFSINFLLLPGVTLIVLTILSQISVSEGPLALHYTCTLQTSDF